MEYIQYDLTQTKKQILRNIRKKHLQFSICYHLEAIRTTIENTPYTYMKKNEGILFPTSPSLYIDRRCVLLDRIHPEYPFYMNLKHILGENTNFDFQMAELSASCFWLSRYLEQDIPLKVPKNLFSALDNWRYSSYLNEIHSILINLHHQIDCTSLSIQTILSSLITKEELKPLFEEIANILIEERQECDSQPLSKHWILTMLSVLAYYINHYSIPKIE